MPTDAMDEVLQGHPAILRACLWATMVDGAVLHEWLVNVGRRSFEQQLAHPFCEVFTRLDAIGLATADTIRMPFTQTMLGDLPGISAVHVQRTMSCLGDVDLISLQDRHLRIPDFAAMADLGEFDAAYLQLPS